MSKSVTKLFTVTLALTIGSMMFSACSDDSGSNPGENLTVMETVQGQSSLSSLSDLLTTYGLADTLSQDGPITLFAPANGALSKVSLADSSDEKATSILEYHIVDLNLTYANLKDRDKAVTLNGDTLYFSTSGDSVIINGGQAFVTSKGTEATNGTIFIIDSLLTVPQNRYAFK